MEAATLYWGYIVQGFFLTLGGLLAIMISYGAVWLVSFALTPAEAPKSLDEVLKGYEDDDDDDLGNDEFGQKVYQEKLHEQVEAYGQQPPKKRK